MNTRKSTVLGIACLALLGLLVQARCDDPAALHTAREAKAVLPWANPPHGFSIRANQAAADIAIPCLPGLKHIQKIEITGVNLSSEQLATIGSKTSVINLSLKDCDINDEDLQLLRKMSSLKTLDLGGNPINGSGISSLRDMRCLTVLRLYSTEIQALGLEDAGKLPSLRLLDLRSTGVDIEGLRALSGQGGRLSAIRISSPNYDSEACLSLAPLLWLSSITLPPDVTADSETTKEKRHAKAEFWLRFRKLRKDALQDAVASGQNVPDKPLFPGVH